jgi:hypothetical protein
VRILRIGTVLFFFYRIEGISPLEFVRESRAGSKIFVSRILLSFYYPWNPWFSGNRPGLNILERSQTGPPNFISRYTPEARNFFPEKLFPSLYLSDAL